MAEPPSSVSPFGGFDVRIDPWAVEYGGETPTEFHADDDELGVDPSVERDAPRGRQLSRGPWSCQRSSQSSTGYGAWRRDSS